MAGVGKTTAAQRVADEMRLQCRFTVVHWINAESEETRVSGFGTLANSLQIDQSRIRCLACWPNLCVTHLINFTAVAVKQTS